MRTHALPFILLALATGCVDVPERPDARVFVDAAIDDLGVDGAAPPDLEPPCMPAAEVCDGLDDDCDGRVDEADPGLCAPCVIPRQVGACAEGRTVCAGGRLECRALGAPPGTGCDFVDGDCDGRWDELGEEPALRDRLVALQCPGEAPRWGRAAESGACPDGDEVGCGPAHPCLDRACVGGCDDRFGLDYAECAIECEASGGANCRPDCREQTNLARQACIADCPPADPNGARWTCGPGEDGPLCAVTACDGGAVFEGERCRRVETCNDGIDDDLDGLVDGSLAEPGRCQAVYLGGNESLIGGCPAGIPGCDGLAAQAPLWSCAESCPYRPRVSYDYALDKEEVSNRAWLACVDAGACTEPAGLGWRQARVLLESDAGPDRPADPPCSGPVRLDPRAGADIDPRVVDLPVTGVSWCQARDYCLWAGKRLPTEVEWERAAAGTVDRQPWPWGAEAPAACDAAQCCGTEGERPITCAAQPLPACPDAPEGGPFRAACQATVGQVDPLCNPADPACPECLPSAAPVWANRDGANPEGVVNLIGNVAEWTYDWASLGYGAASPLDPVGPACNQLTLAPADDSPQGRRLRGAGQRITRGGDFLRRGVPLDVMARAPFPPSTQLPAIGFRCARTMQLGQGGRPVVCNPGTLGQPPPPVPPPPDPRPNCLEPEFDDDRDALGVCPGDQRVASGNCLEGVARTCATGTPLDCGAFVTRSMTVDFDGLQAFIDRIRPFLGGLDPRLPTIDELASDFIGRLFDADLVPNGGKTLLLLETGCGFGGNGAFQSRLVNGAVVGDALFEMGLVAPDAACLPLSTPPVPLVTQEPGVVDNACVRARGEIFVLGLGARLPYSGTMFFDAALDVARGELAGMLMYIVSLADAADSALGDDSEGAVRDFLTAAQAPPADLCALQLLGQVLDPPPGSPQVPPPEVWRCQDFHGWPGCVNGVCQGIGGDRSMCTGWLVPLRFQATAREHIDLGAAACTCGG